MIADDKLRQRRKEVGLSLKEVADKIGVTEATVSRWESGDIANMKRNYIIRYAEALRVSPMFLLDAEEQASCIRSILKDKTKSSADQTKIPLYSYVSAGRGALTSDSNIEGYVSLSNELVGTGDYFALRVRGDSMEPTICDRDIVIVRSQETANDGDTVVAVVNGDEGFVKRLMIEPSGIVLASNNSSYRPMFFSQEQINELPVRIAGVVVELRRTF